MTFRRAYGVLVVLAVACGGSVATSDDTTGTDSGTTGGDATTGGPDGSTGVDGGVPVGDSSVPPTQQPIACGDAGSCDPSTQVCCVTGGGGGGGISTACTAIGSCMGSSFSCESAKNCTMGEVCCADFMGGMGGGSITATCKPMCAGGFMEPQLCADSSECPMGQVCRNAFGGLKICRNPPPDGGFPPPKDAGGPG